MSEIRRCDSCGAGLGPAMHSCLRCGAPAPAPAPADVGLVGAANGRSRADALAGAGGAGGAGAAGAEGADGRQACAACGARLGVDATWCGLCLEPVRPAGPEPAPSATGSGGAGWSGGGGDRWAGFAGGGVDPDAVGGVVVGAREPWQPSTRRAAYVAPRWRTGLATFVDSLIMAGLAAVLAQGNEQRFFEAAVLLRFLNKCVLQGLTGQNAGKWLFGIKLVRTSSGEPPGVLRAFGRELAHFFDGAALCLGYLWPLWDDKRQTFADKIADTMPVLKSAPA